MSREILEDYADRIVNISSEADISREIVGLVSSIGSQQGFNLQLQEQKNQLNHNARLDVGVKIDELLCGFIEIKKPGKGANPAKFRELHDKRQWNNLKALPNLIYTDGIEWALYRCGERIKSHNIVRLADDIASVGKDTITDEMETSFKGLFKDFLSWEPIVPKEPKNLAKYLAPYSEFLRSEVEISLKTSGTAIRLLANDWREIFFPDADDLQFADAYAQTVTYALLLARLAGATDLSPRIAAHTLDKNNGLLAKTLEILVQDEARAEIIVGYSLIQRILEKLDTEKISKSKPDLWIYFYESFLEEYNPEMRRDLGVYYTPKEIVKLQIKLTSQLLENKFKKPLGYADKDVKFIDPAVGTGTYLVEAIEHGLNSVEQKFGRMKPAMASQIADNMHGFEILVGPYAVAHLRLTQAIEDAMNSEKREGEPQEKLKGRLKIFLADTLESPETEQNRPKTLFDFFKKITEENKAARELKSEGKILVCVGNPPYNRQEISIDQTLEERNGGWVRYGEGNRDTHRNTETAKPILEDFFEVDKETDRVLNVGAQLHNLYNDYVYFWRWSLWRLFEKQETGGIVSFITPSSYLKGPGFAGMRNFMRKTFDELWIIDLGGNQLGARRTPNVFPSVRIPVAIAIGLRGKKPSNDTPAKVKYVKIEAESRDGKLKELEKISNFSDVNWTDCRNDWYDTFLPVRIGSSEKFYEWPKLSDLFPWRHSGVQMNRKWPIAETQSVLEKRLNKLISSATENKRSLFKESRDRKIDEPVIGLDGMQKIPLKECKNISECLPILRYSYRFLDRRYVVFDERLIDWPRPQLMQVIGEKNVLFAAPTDNYDFGPAIFATKEIPDLNFLERGGKIFPLYRDLECKDANIAKGVLSILTENYGFEVTAIDFASYVYGILGGQSYVAEFWDELELPDARVPITKDESLFREISKLGGKLLSSHTDGWHKIKAGKAKLSKSIPHDSSNYPDGNDVRYDSDLMKLHIGEGVIEPVPPEVWNYGYADKLVVKSWIRSRTKSGSGRKAVGLNKIRPDSWSAEMSRELLNLLWIVETTVSMEPKLKSALEKAMSSMCFSKGDFPVPEENESKPPTKSAVRSEQLQLDL